MPIVKPLYLEQNPKGRPDSPKVTLQNENLVKSFS